MEKLCCSSKGQALILFAAILAGLLALTALAIDVGMAYAVKTKLNAAVDAAALAAGRVVSQGENAIKAEAENFFNANYPNQPNGFLGATVQALNTVPVHNPVDGSWTIEVSATATSPAYFAKAVGWHNLSVNASATTTVRTTDLILVMDCSSSLDSPPSPLNTFSTLQTAAINFIKNFDTSSDRVGLIHFASGAVTDVPITSTRGFDADAIKSAINNFTPVGNTTSEEALRLAKAQLDAIPSTSRSGIRTIVFFSDGAPNGIVGNFSNGPNQQAALYSETEFSIDYSEDVNGTPYCNCPSNCVNPLAGGTGIGDKRTSKMYTYNSIDAFISDYCNVDTLPPTDYTGSISLESYNGIRVLAYNGSNIVNTWCNANKAARNMLENVANAARSEAENPIQVFTIGFGLYLTQPEATYCAYGSNEYGENILKRVANVPGVDTYHPSQPKGAYVHADNPAQLNEAFHKIASFILRLSR